jgi:hypothetical protein
LVVEKSLGGTGFVRGAGRRHMKRFKFPRRRQGRSHVADAISLLPDVADSEKPDQIRKNALIKVKQSVQSGSGFEDIRVPFNVRYMKLAVNLRQPKRNEEVVSRLVQELVDYLEDIPT